MTKVNSLTGFDVELLENVGRRFPSHSETMAGSRVAEAKGVKPDHELVRAIKFHSTYGHTQGDSGNALIAASDPNSIGVVVSEIDMGQYKGIHVAIVFPEGQDFSSVERRAEQHDAVLDVVERELSRHGLKVPGEFSDILVGDDRAVTQARKLVESEFSQHCLPVPESVRAAIHKGNDTLLDEVTRGLTENGVSVSAEFRSALSQASGLPMSRDYRYPDGAAKGYPDGVGYLKISVSEGAMPQDLKASQAIVGSYREHVTNQHKVAVPISLVDQVAYGTPQARLDELDKRTAAWEGVFRSGLKAGEAQIYSAKRITAQVIANLSSQFSDNKDISIDELKMSMGAASKAACNIGDFKVIHGTIKALESVRDDVGALKCRVTNMDRTYQVSHKSGDFIDVLLERIKPQFEKAREIFYKEFSGTIRDREQHGVPLREIMVDLVVEHGLSYSVFMDVRNEMNKSMIESRQHESKTMPMKSSRQSL